MGMENLYKQFPDIHPNIVLKSDVLRQGMNISKPALDHFRRRDDLLCKGFHLFSYDFKKTKVYKDKIPWL